MWFWYAVSASILWGVGYVINQVLMKTLSSIEIIVVESFIILSIFVPWLFYGNNIKGLFLKLADIKILLLVLIGSAIYITAAILILKSISIGNATLAAVIEASYPIFTMLFAYVLLGEVQFSLYTIIGCIFIIVGLVIVHRGN